MTFSMIELIEKKKNGQALTKEELRSFVTNLVAGKIPDYQTSALLMAIWFRGMTMEETFEMTMAMRDSGMVLDLTAIGNTIDKHSTGGIGDKLSLIVLPLWAACGLSVVKLSGRGLGYTGGTVDKLEAVDGVSVTMTAQEFLERAARDRLVISGQSSELAPADGILYALRDVTATVDSLPLIAASIMSKKLAVKADTLVLDVKFGRGALMKTRADAERLAQQMVDIGQRAGQRVAAMFSPMDQPLGHCVGNALEVKEAVEILSGGGSSVLRDAALTLTSLGLYWHNGGNPVAAKQQALEALTGGDGLRALARLLRQQGARFEGDDIVSALPLDNPSYVVRAESSGYVQDIDALQIGMVSVFLGAGRQEKDDTIDPAAGIVLPKEVGEYVEKGGTLAVLYGQGDLSAQVPAVRRAIKLNTEQPDVKDCHVCRCLIDGEVVLSDALFA